MEIARIILPIVIVGGIVLFVIGRLKRNYNQGEMSEKKPTGTKHLLDMAIPLGMLFGCAIGVILGIFFPTSALYTVSLGAGIGYLAGYFAYNMYTRKQESST